MRFCHRSNSIWENEFSLGLFGAFCFFDIAKHLLDFLPGHAGEFGQRVGERMNTTGPAGTDALRAYGNAETILAWFATIWAGDGLPARALLDVADAEFVEDFRD
jgi:hypothetical protein